MAKDSTRVKPDKPREGFPLFAHANGWWAKKIKGRLHYFGSWRDDPKGEAALAVWLEQRDDLLAGRTPRGKREGVTVADACNAFLDSKDRQRKTGDLSPRTFAEYEATCKRLAQRFGRGRLVEDLRADDFGKYRLWIGKKWGVHRVGNEVQRVRSVFKHAYETDLIDRPVKFGPEFKRPTKKAIRKARQDAGPRMFTAAEIRAILDSAKPQLRAMVLLGINAGLGPGDLGELREKHIDLEAAMLTYPRPKTGVPRRAVLWAETCEAIREALRVRPKAKNAADADLVFVTKYGKAWTRFEESTGSKHTATSHELNKLLRDLGIKRPGLGMYGLRHACQTIGEGAGDPAAVARVMGHERDDMATVYREWEGDPDEERRRLQAVADRLHGWLWPAEKKTTSRQRGA